MRILLVSPVDPLGAAHNRIHDFLKALVRHHKVDVVSTYAWWLREGRESPYGSGYYVGSLSETLSKVHVEYLTTLRRNPALQELGAVVDGPEILRTLGEVGYDLIVNYNAILSSLVFSEILGSPPMVTDLADDIVSMAAAANWIPRTLRAMVQTAAPLPLGLSIRRSRVVTVTTKSLADVYRVPVQKTMVLPNGVDGDVFTPRDREEAKSELGLAGKFIVGYVGVLRDWVDIEMMLGPVKHLAELDPPPHLLVLGSEGGVGALLDRARELGIRDRVVITGTLPYDRVPLALSAMDVGLVPFRLNAVTANALPMKVFEYMACCVPVVSQNLGPVHDTLGDAVEYASTPMEFADKVQQLMHSPDQREAIAERGRQLVLANWTWDRLGCRLEEAIQRATGVS